MQTSQQLYEDPAIVASEWTSLFKQLGYIIKKESDQDPKGQTAREVEKAIAIEKMK